MARTIPLPFEAKVTLNSDGSYDIDTTIEQITAMLEDANEDKVNGTNTVVETVKAMFVKSGEEYLPRGAIATTCMNALMAGPSNWSAKEKVVKDALLTCLTGSVSGSRLCTPEEASEIRERRATNRAANKAKKAAKLAAAK